MSVAAPPPVPPGLELAHRYTLDLTVYIAGDGQHRDGHGAGATAVRIRALLDELVERDPHVILIIGGTVPRYLSPNDG